jgi:hypothetical protein
MLRGAFALIAVLLLRSAIHGLRGRPLGVARGTTSDVPVVSGWVARFWGLLTLAGAVLCFAIAAGGFAE